MLHDALFGICIAGGRRAAIPEKRFVPNDTIGKLFGAVTVSPWGEQTRRHENEWSLGTSEQGLVTWGVCRP